jgi:hypothetical protein
VKVTLNAAWRHYGQCSLDQTRIIREHGPDSLEAAEARVRVWAASCLIDTLQRAKDLTP